MDIVNQKKILRRYGSLLLAGILLTSISGTTLASIRFEYCAINVQNPKEVAAWYVKLKIISESKKMIFVGDPDRHFMFELYNKADAKGKY